MEAVAKLARFLEDAGMPTLVSSIRREHVEAWMVEELGTTAPTSASIRYRAAQQFFKWCVAEGEVEVSPMVNMTPPKVPEDPPPVLTTDSLRALLKACEGTRFEDRRDMAIVRLFLDTGMRRLELANLKVEDVDFRTRVAVVLGKGGRHRACPFGARTAQAMDRYLRARARHRLADLPYLWLGLSGPMTDNGIANAVRKRARKAGINERVNLQRFRHTYAHEWLLAGGEGEDLMALAGWKSRTMLTRYGASMRAERAREAYKRLSLGDRL
jgi:site-specific recombinase XerD